MSQLVTGEAVVLQVRLARMPTRALASALDVVVQFMALGVLSALLIALPEDASEALIGAVVIILVALVLIGYRLVMETLTRGRTLGKMALGLRVVCDDGSSIRFRHALVRSLLWLFVDFAPWFAMCPGIVASLVNKQGKRIGDMVAGTVVIRERHQSIASPPLFVPGHLVPWAFSLELSRLTDDLANTVREYLARFTELEPAAREAIGEALAAKVAQATAPPPPVPMVGPAYLSAVLAERRRRELARLAAQSSMFGPGGAFGSSRFQSPHGVGPYAAVPLAQGPWQPTIPPQGPFPAPQRPYDVSPAYGGPSYHSQQYGVPPAGAPGGYPPHVPR